MEAMVLCTYTEKNMFLRGVPTEVMVVVEDILFLEAILNFGH
jgi:hypothetical protein